MGIRQDWRMGKRNTWKLVGRGDENQERWEAGENGSREDERQAYGRQMQSMRQVRIVRKMVGYGDGENRK